MQAISFFLLSLSVSLNVTAERSEAVGVEHSGESGSSPNLETKPKLY